VLRTQLPKCRVVTASGFEASAARLQPPSCRIGLAQVRLSVDGISGVPFFEADYLRASLLVACSSSGIIALDEIAVTNGRYSIVRGPIGRTNLPDSSDSRGGDTCCARYRASGAPRFRVEFKTWQSGLILRIPGINIDIGRTAGRISLVAPAALSAGMYSTALSAFERGAAAFDGRSERFECSTECGRRIVRGLDGAVFLLVRADGSSIFVLQAPCRHRAARAMGISRTAKLPRGTNAFEAHSTGAFATPGDRRFRKISFATARERGRPAPEDRGRSSAAVELCARCRLRTARVPDEPERMWKNVRVLSPLARGGKVTGKGLIPFVDSRHT
jgi:hypothetical protein